MQAACMCASNAFSEQELLAKCTVLQDVCDITSAANAYDDYSSAVKIKCPVTDAAEAAAFTVTDFDLTDVKRSRNNRLLVII